jgi:hypothetical protein
MAWPVLAGMAGLSLFSQMQENKAQLKAQIAENRAIRKANKINTDRTGFQVGLLNVQRGQQVRQQIQNKADLGSSELSVAGTASNNAAAAGNVGASADAVQSDIQMRFDRARAELAQAGEVEALNFNTQLYSTLEQGIDNLQQARKVESKGIGEMLLTTGLQMGGQYLGAKMQLGLGEATQPQQPFVGPPQQSMLGRAGSFATSTMNRIRSGFGG